MINFKLEGQPVVYDIYLISDDGKTLKFGDVSGTTPETRPTAFATHVYSKQ